MIGGLVTAGLAVASIPYNVVKHPVKTYRLVVHGVGWYDPMYNPSRRRNNAE